MRKNATMFGLALAMAAMLCLAAAPAQARPHGGLPLGGLGKALAGAGGHHGKGGLPNLSRAIRNGGGHGANLGGLIGQGLRNAGRNGGGHGANLGGLIGQGLRNAGRNGGGHGANLGGLIGEGLRNGSIGNGQLLQTLGDAVRQGHGGWGYGRGGYGYGGYGYSDYDMSKAYRDVGIANAVVGLVGIAAQAAQNGAYYGGYAQPAQQYYRERVLVSPARYETKQVWVPESFDPRTGAKIGGGFYETRTELIPEVYEERMVPAPVAPPAPVAYAPAPMAVPYTGGMLLPPPPMPVPVPVPMHGSCAPGPWGGPGCRTVR